jgi:hypothetical protein
LKWEPSLTGDNTKNDVRKMMSGTLTTGLD